MSLQASNGRVHSSGNADQIAYWNDRAAVTWTLFQERLDALFEPLTVRLVDAAAPATGETAIDIGCGCGATVLALAGRVGSAGKVMGFDVSEPMAARARERIIRAGYANARVIVSDAATHDFSGVEADLLFSRFGVMFFADPVAAFTNLRSAMRPTGRLCCAVWRPLSENPWFSVPLEAARPLLPPQPASDPDAPGPFALANRDRTRAILENSGWRDVKLTRLDVPMRIAGPGQIAEASEFATRVGALARVLADTDSETRENVRRAIGTALQPYDGPNGVALPGSLWLVSARA